MLEKEIHAKNTLITAYASSERGDFHSARETKKNKPKYLKCSFLFSNPMQKEEKNNRLSVPFSIQEINIAE